MWRQSLSTFGSYKIAFIGWVHRLYQLHLRPLNDDMVNNRGFLKEDIVVPMRLADAAVLGIVA